MSTTKSKLEQVLEYLVNNESEKAQELLHDVIVEKARKIHEELIENQTDEIEEDLTTENTEEAVDEAEKSDDEAVEEVLTPTPPPAKEEPKPVQKEIEVPPISVSEPQEEAKEEKKDTPRLKVLGKIDLGTVLFKSNVFRRRSIKTSDEKTYDEESLSEDFKYVGFLSSLPQEATAKDVHDADWWFFDHLRKMEETNIVYIHENLFYHH